MANGKIKKGDKFTYENLIPKRPGYGISPSQIDLLVGLTCGSDLEDDTVITSEHVVEDAPFKPITEDLLLQTKNL